MRDPSPENQSRHEEDGAGTRTRRFLARRGVLLVKETRDIDVLHTNYGYHLTVISLVLGIANSGQGEASFGIRLEQFDPDGQCQGGAYLDLDELHELSGALEYIQTIAGRMTGEQRDYTKVTYATRDNVRFGFYQSTESQQAYTQIDEHLDMVFIPVAGLRDLRRAIDKARAHLESKAGACKKRTE